MVRIAVTSYQNLLPATRSIAGEIKRAYPRRTMLWLTERETVGYLSQQAPAFIPPCLWPTNSPYLNPVDCDVTQRQSTLAGSAVTTTLSSVLSKNGIVSITESPSELFDSGTFDCTRVIVKTVATLSTCSSLANYLPICETAVLRYNFINVCIPETTQGRFLKFASCMSVKL